MGSNFSLIKLIISIVMLTITLISSAFGESLSYSGRLVNNNGSPVTGPVNLKFDLASTANTSIILCSQQITNVALTHGVFHVKLDLNCGASTLSQVLGAIVSPESAAIRVTNESASHAYSFQSLHAVPSAQIAHGLAKLNANNNEVLTWTGSKWEPKPVSGATGGTVTDITAGSGLSGGTIINSGTIAIANGGVTDSHLAGSIARTKLASGTANYVIVNNGSGVMSEVAQLPLTQGGTGSNTAAGARINLGLGDAAVATIGYGPGQVLPGEVPICLAHQKLQMNLGPTFWSCANDNDALDATKLPLGGGTMSGAIAMGNNQITGLAAPALGTDAANKDYVDTKVTSAPGDNLGNHTATTNLAMGTNKILVGDGTWSSPGITFTNSLNTGLFNNSGILGFSANGGLAMNLSSSTLILNGSFAPYMRLGGGTFGAAAPTYSFGGDPDTGMFNLATNMLGFTTGGVEKMRILATGEVAIGKATAAEKLDVAGSIALDGKLRLNSDNANYVTLKAPDSLSATFNYTLPLTAPTAGQVLSSNAAGVMSWITSTSSPITTVFGRTGAVTATSGDYSGSLITNVPAGTIASTTVQSAIDELASEKQNTDSTLTSLAAYNTNGILVQTAADTFIGRSIAGIANRTTVTNGDGVAGNPTINVDANLLPSPIAGDAGKFLQASGANASAWMALDSGDITTALGFTPVNKAGDSLSSGTFSFSGTSLLQNANSPVNLTDVTNKQYVDNAVSAVNLWSTSGGHVYRSTGNVGIGVAAPLSPLHIKAAAAGIFLEETTGGAGNEAYVVHYNNNLEIQNRDSAGTLSHIPYRFDIRAPVATIVANNLGNVGIGTTTPAGKLEVASSATFLTNGSGANTFLRSTSSANSDYMAIGWLGEDTWGIMSADNLTHRNLVLQPAAGGFVGIGTTSPAQKLHVVGAGLFSDGTDDVGNLSRVDSSFDINTHSAKRSLSIHHYGGNATMAQIYYCPGGVCAQKFMLDNAGNLAIAGTLSQASDIRLKKDIQLVTDNLEKLSLLKGVTYFWKDSPDSSKQLGLIAQDVEKVYPEAVKKNKDGFLSVSYQTLVAPIIEAIKELAANDKELKREIASLKEQNELLMKQNEMFEKRLNALEKKDAKKKGP